MRKQIIICFDDGKWLCDFISTQDDKPDQELIDDYLQKYEETKNSNDLIGKMLPSIIHISIMGDKK